MKPYPSGPRTYKSLAPLNILSGLLGCLDLNFLGFYGVQNIGAKDPSKQGSPGFLEVGGAQDPSKYGSPASRSLASGSRSSKSGAAGRASARDVVGELGGARRSGSVSCVPLHLGFFVCMVSVPMPDMISYDSPGLPGHPLAEGPHHGARYQLSPILGFCLWQGVSRFGRC